MTLLASERSLLIRNKFRSVLQLRIQNRRQQNEINSDSGVKSTCHPQLGEKEKECTPGCLSDDSPTHKAPPSGGLNTEPAKSKVQDWSCGAGLKQKRARLAEDLSEKIQRRPGPLELLQKHILPLEATPIPLPELSDLSEDDISCSSSSSSSSPEQLGIHQSPGFSASPGLVGEQSLSDSSHGASLSQSPNSFQCSLALPPVTEGICQTKTMTVIESDSMATPRRAKGIFLTIQAPPLLPKTAQPSTSPPQSCLASSVPPTRPPRSKKPRDSKPKIKKLKYHQYIPPDQRGGAGGVTSGGSTPVPPIDPAYSRLLQQQQVFLQLQILNQQQQQQQNTLTPSPEPQIVQYTGATPSTCPQPVPIATNPGCSPDPIHKPELLPTNLDDLTVSELRQQLRKRGLPVSGTKPSLLERLRPYQLPRPCLAPTPLCPPGTPVLAPNLSPDLPADTYRQHNNLPSRGSSEQASGFLAITNTTALPLPSSSPLTSGISWRPGQAAEEISVEMEMRERIRSRPRDRTPKICLDVAGDSSPDNSLHPFLQQEPGCERESSETHSQTEVLFTQPCDAIGQDFELPMQITASPVQTSSSGRSLEEELQEAIQRVLMAPSQSIDDILDEPVSCTDTASSVSESQTVVSSLSGSSPPSHVDQSPSFLHPSKDENPLSSPLCSSLLLELPPSPSSSIQLCQPQPPPPPPICTTPPTAALSRKRREAATFDPADWLESLTSGLRPLTPPAAPFVETDFGLDSDLNVNRILDLMVEQW
uniref:Myocardin-like n=1 Tax=Paramormyrops kingsleyae TaxID=1676925 RepID=A0A3B3SQ45_9TELE|nr:myocardin-like [Paramormyrops kingsleyae]XP_023685773.1 myocardin-like [Paramormyrops kingsleyae]